MREWAVRCIQRAAGSNYGTRPLFVGLCLSPREHTCAKLESVVQRDTGSCISGVVKTIKKIVKKKK